MSKDERTQTGDDLPDEEWITEAAERIDSQFFDPEWRKTDMIAGLIREEYDRARPKYTASDSLPFTGGGNAPLIMFSGAVDEKKVGPIKYGLMDKVWGRTFKEWLQIEEYARKHGYKPGGESEVDPVELVANACPHPDCGKPSGHKGECPPDSPAPVCGREYYQSGAACRRGFVTTCQLPEGHNGSCSLYSPAPVSADVVDEKKFVALLDECCECCEGDGRYECGASPETNRAYKEVVLAFRNLAAERDQYQKESIRRWEKDYFPEMRKRQQAEARLGKVTAERDKYKRHYLAYCDAVNERFLLSEDTAIERGPEEVPDE